MTACDSVVRVRDLRKTLESDGAPRRRAPGGAPETVTPIPATLLVVPAVLLLVNVAAAVPARLAARTPPAVVLRAE